MKNKFLQLWKLSKQLDGKFAAKIALSFIFALFLTVQLSAQEISTSVTWTGTVHLTDDVTVTDTGILTIEAGTKVISDGYYKIIVNGQLIAQGTDGNEILFTALDTNIGWGGIEFDNGPAGADGAMDNNDQSVIDHCIFEYGKTINLLPDVTIEFDTGGGTYDYCDHLYENGGALRLISFENILIQNSVFRNNTAYNGGGAIAGAPATDMTITNCTFTDNYAGGHGGAIKVGSYSTFMMIDCTISDNSVGDGSPHLNGKYENGGGIHTGSYMTGTISTSTITNNIVTGVYSNELEDLIHQIENDIDFELPKIIKSSQYLI